MGLETVCRVRLNNEVSEGKAHCGDGELEFRGDFKVRWKWSELTSVSEEDGVLLAVRGGDKAEFHLGDAAAKWAHAIRNPKSRLDKLGLKPGQAYACWGEFDDSFASECAERAGSQAEEAPFDIVFVHLHTRDDLSKVSVARDRIQSNGAVWAVWAKGRKELNENDVRAYALANGLVDVKVASFSSMFSSLKLVIPVSKRQA
ncbi:MAG: hypothetical protein JSS65_07460 [Armatimonadetes bacterium]|nr:hypothetical protein [Armatimonadota bacterium]